MYFGSGEDYLLFPDAPSDYYIGGPDYMKSWNTLYPRLQKWGVKVVRLAAIFSDAPYTRTGWSQPSFLDYDKLDQVIAFLASKNIKVILDLCHEAIPNWYGTDAWINDWVIAANRYKNDSRIYAYELFNEIGRVTWSPEIQAATIYPDPYRLIQHKLAVCTDAIRATGDTHTLIWPDHMQYENYNYVYYDASDLRPNIIQTWHCWMNQWAVDSYPPDGMGWWNVMKNNIVTFQARYPNIPNQIGEIGGYTDATSTLPGGRDAQREFIVAIINWCVANNIDCLWWYLSTNHWVKAFADEVLSASAWATTLPVQHQFSVTSNPSGIPFTLRKTG